VAPQGHLAHLSSYRDNPIVFFTVCTHRRQALVASTKCHAILRELWERSASHDGWWVGHYILMPDHVHFFARPEIDARPMAKWVQLWKGVSGRRIARALQVSPPIWQADYFD
jgi:putative transposase